MSCQPQSISAAGHAACDGVPTEKVQDFKTQSLTLTETQACPPPGRKKKCLPSSSNYSASILRTPPFVTATWSLVWHSDSKLRLSSVWARLQLAWSLGKLEMGKRELPSAVRDEFCMCMVPRYAYIYIYIYIYIYLFIYLFIYLHTHMHAISRFSGAEVLNRSAGSLHGTEAAEPSDLRAGGMKAWSCRCTANSRSAQNSRL